MTKIERETPNEIIKGLGELGQDVPVSSNIPDEIQTTEKIVTNRSSPSGAEQLD